MASREYPAEFGWRVIILVESGRPAATACASTVLIQVVQDRFEVVRVGEETNHSCVITPFDVELAARKASQPTGPQAVDAGRLSGPRRARASYSLDVSQRLDRSVEEALTEDVAALGSVVLASLDQVGLGQRTQSDVCHTIRPSARARSSSTTSDVNGRPSPDSSPSAISMRKRRASSAC